MTDPRLLSPETRELLAVLGKLNQLVPGLTLGILDGSVSLAKQVEFGGLLVAAGELVRTYGWRQGVVESDSVTDSVVSDADREADGGLRSRAIGQ